MSEFVAVGDAFVNLDQVTRVVPLTRYRLRGSKGVQPLDPCLFEMRTKDGTLNPEDYDFEQGCRVYYVGAADGGVDFDEFWGADGAFIKGYLWDARQILQR